MEDPIFGILNSIRLDAPETTALVERHVKESEAIRDEDKMAAPHCMRQAMELLQHAVNLERRLKKAHRLTFQSLAKTNLARAMRWHKDGLNDWLVSEWTNAMAGEAGEACNAAKKLRRIECGMQQADGDSPAPKTLEEARRKVGKEIGDTVIYGDLCAQKVGLTLEECIIEAFNQISVREGFPERL